MHLWPATSVQGQADSGFDSSRRIGIVSPDPSPQVEHRSPRSTTNWAELPSVKAVQGYMELSSGTVFM
jgi:hypothetical protein